MSANRSPWIAVRADLGFEIHDNSGRCIAHFPADACHCPGCEQEAKKRASLIAAAPALLAAGENARDMLAIDRQSFVDSNRLRDMRIEDPVAHGLVGVDDGVWITPENAEELRDYDRAIALIDVAIAKAAGSAS